MTAPVRSFGLWSRSRLSRSLAGCALKSPMLGNALLWGRCGPRALFAKRNHHEFLGLGRRTGLAARFRSTPSRGEGIWHSTTHSFPASQAATRRRCSPSLRTTDRLRRWLNRSRASNALLAESTDLERLVRSPVFSANDQLKALDAVLARAGIDGISANFVRLVAVKRRLFVLRDMIAAYRKLYDASRGVTRAEVVTATTLSDQNLAALKDQLRAVSGGRDVDLDSRSTRRSSAGWWSASARGWSTARSGPSSMQFA